MFDCFVVNPHDCVTMILERGPVEGLSEIIFNQFTSRVVHHYHVTEFDFISCIKLPYIDMSCYFCTRSFPICFETNSVDVILLYH